MQCTVECNALQAWHWLLCRKCINHCTELKCYLESDLCYRSVSLGFQTLVSFPYIQLNKLILQHRRADQTGGTRVS